MRNFFPIAHGAALNRPGTRLAADRAGKDHSLATWLIPFVYSELTNQAYAIELGNLYARFIVNGAYIAPNPASYAAYAGGTTYAKGAWVSYGGVAYTSLQDGNTGHQPDVSPTWWSSPAIYEVVTPYAAADLARLQFAQEGDVVTLTHPGYTTRELKRWAHANWTISEVSFDVPVSSSYWYGFGLVADPLQVADATHFARPWKWFVTTIERDARGFLYETAPFEVLWYTVAGSPPVRTALPQNRVVYPDKAVQITAFNNGGLIVIPDSTAQIVEFRLYRGMGKLHQGFVNAWPGPESNGLNIWDDGQTPDYSNGPPQARNPFKVYGIQGQVEVLLRTENPACVAFFERRRVFANLGIGATPYRPTLVFASQIDFFTNFDEHTVSKATDSVEITVSSRLREEIRWILGTHKLLIGTNSGVYAAGGAGGTPLSASEIPDVKSQSEEGCAWLHPVVAGDHVLYVEARGDGVRELAWDDLRQKFLAQPLSWISEHLFLGYSVVDWGYARKPWSVIWAVRSDGKLLSLTYLKQLDVWGWAWHDLGGGGAAESVCVVPEGAEDVLYVVVRRTIGGATKRYVERLTSRRVADRRLGVFLDSSLTYDGRNTGPVTMTVTEIAGGGYDAGASVTLTSSAAYFNIIGGGADADEIVLDPDGAPCRLVITGYTDPTHVTAEVLTPAVPAAFQAVATTSWARAVDEFSGLGHLEGQTVLALADGSVVRQDAANVDLVVVAGAIVLPQPAVVVHVGLSYLSELELLDVAPASADAKGREKNVKRALVEIEKSDGLRVGPSLAALSLWKDRRPGPVEQVGDGPVKLYTGIAEVAVAGDWGKHGRVAVQQADPLPCTVAAVTREVDFGG